MRTKTAAQGVMPDLPHLAVEDTLLGAKLALPCANLLLCSGTIEEAVDSLHIVYQLVVEYRVSEEGDANCGTGGSRRDGRGACDSQRRERVDLQACAPEALSSDSHVFQFSLLSAYDSEPAPQLLRWLTMRSMCGQPLRLPLGQLVLRRTMIFLCMSFIPRPSVRLQSTARWSTTLPFVLHSAPPSLRHRSSLSTPCCFWSLW